MKKTNLELVSFIKENSIDKTSKELALLVNKKFNKNFNEVNIKYYKHKYKIKSMSDGKFKKGNKPTNGRPIYSERKDKEGYIWVKVSKTPNKWIRKNRYIYEMFCGKIPQGYTVVFLDQNKDNFDINNLALISKKEQLLMRNFALFSKNKDITKTGIMIAKLINKTSEIKNRR